MYCANCGTKVSGQFCSSCGKGVGGSKCPKCGNTPEPGAEFCNMCGTGMAGAPGHARAAGSGRAAGVGSGDSSKVAWWISGALLMGIILVVVWPVIQGGNSAAPLQQQSPQNAASTDLNSMTPRAAADALFDRVMRAAAAGDAGEFGQFLPMAIAAHERAQPLDADGKYHLATLLFQGSSFAESLAVVEEVLADDPNHLLALSAAGRAAAEMGDSAAARTYYTHMLDVWNGELARDLPEYQAHEGERAQIEQAAEAFLGTGG